ncbi:MAG TPA: hypothetical protein VIM48_11830, partial [Chthoniobacterales bacterium]
ANGVKQGTYLCAVTANLFTRNREACADAGMNDILAKPLRRDDLAAILTRCGKIAADRRATI